MYEGKHEHRVNKAGKSEQRYDPVTVYTFFKHDTCALVEVIRNKQRNGMQWVQNG